MRKSGSVVIIRTLCLVVVGAAVASPMACSTADTATPGADDGGTGGDGAPVVEPPKPCEKNTDCSSGICNTSTKLCAVASCKDGTKNANESDVDCGGDCAKCDMGKGCKVGGDCTTGVCKDAGEGLKCQAPTNTDGVKNGNETGIDCGGNGNDKCPDGQGCATQDDCANDYCTKGICTATNPPDGVKNGTETDVDCGGVGNTRCADLKACLIAGDCKSSVCTGNVCRAPTYTDGVKNGTETDKDCGGDPTGNNGCAVDGACLVAKDCASQGCNYAKKCVPAKSCTARYGGDTCGLGGDGGFGAAQWESCCTALPVTTANGGTVYMDKYPTTAGRYRVFLEAIGYNVRAFVEKARTDGLIPAIPETVSGVVDGSAAHPVLDPTWDKYLPVSFAGNQNAAELSEGAQQCTYNPATGALIGCAEGPVQAGVYTSVRNHLGGTIFRGNAQTSTGCFTTSPGTHSFRFPPAQQDSPPDHPVEVYDTKTLNCVDYLMAQAFCVWDGGRLETFTEWQAAIGPGTYPWSAVEPRAPEQQSSATSHFSRFPTAQDNNQATVNAAFKWDPTLTTIEFANYTYSYEWPVKINNDYIVHLNAPGRLRGRGPLGHSDLLGTGFEVTSSVNWQAGVDTNRDSGALAARFHWSGNGSWEGHGYSPNYTGNTMLLNKYGKIGMRCVRFAP